MKGSAEVIAVLNEVLGFELIGINQYFLHSRMCQSWGFLSIGEKIYKDSIDEMKHAQILIDRILFLEGIPNVQKLGKIKIGETIPEQFKSDLELEIEAIKILRSSIVVCEKEEDFQSRDMLQKILISEEYHADWLEVQLNLMSKVGEKAYLAEHLK